MGPSLREGWGEKQNNNSLDSATYFDGSNLSFFNWDFVIWVHL